MTIFLKIGASVLIDIAGGILSSVLVSFLFHLNFSAPFYLFGICAALFPDTDFLIRFLVEGKVLNLDGVLHRKYLHHPFWIIIIFGGIFYNFLSVEYAILFILGVLYHFIHDSVDDGYGVYWLWPFFRKRYQFYPLRSWTEEEILRDITKNSAKN